jgi:hypothetical protein
MGWYGMDWIDNRRFGGTYHFRLQDRRISRARNQRESKWQAEKSACRNFGLHTKTGGAFMLVSCLAYSSILKMEAICFPEASVVFQRTTQCYTPEDRTLHNHQCEDLKSYNFSSFLHLSIHRFRHTGLSTSVEN